LVQDVEDVGRLELPADAKVAYLTQTTLSVDDANVIIAALKARFPRLVGPPTEDICYATQNRQEAVRDLAPQADLVLVLGSQNSSNSQRLVELARECGKPAYLIDGVGELSEEWLRGVETVLVTAGASAPEEVVQECVRFLRDRYEAVELDVHGREEHVRFPLPKELRLVS
jgi:4-hydroxy-3-methylbut-2-enyl diphosphate reductase